MAAGYKGWHTGPGRNLVIKSGMPLADRGRTAVIL